jgi:hypothetical protein
VVGAKEATCSEAGYTGDTVCSVCNTTLATGTVIETLPHTPVTDKGYAPTCTTTGLSDGSHCDTCGVVLEAQAVLPIAPHNEKIIPGKEPGCLNSGLSEGIVCADCGATVKQQTVLPRLGHSYTYVNNGETHTGTCSRCSKTTTAAHNYKDGTCICGASLTPEATVDEAVAIQHSLNLASDISINYAVRYDYLENYDSYYLECEIPVFENNVQIGTRTEKIDSVFNGFYHYFTLEGLNAVSMTHKVRATLHMTKDGQSFVSKEDIYCIADYAYTQLNKDTSAESLKILSANLLRYGTLTQEYKNYCTDNLPDARLTEAQRGLLTDLNGITFETVNRTLDDLADPKVTWSGKSLILDSKVTLRYVVDLTACETTDNITLRIRYKDHAGTEQTAVLTQAEPYGAVEDYYSFDFSGLLAAELRTVLQAAVYAGDTQISNTLEYSVDTYGNNKTGTLDTLCRALMAYSDAAKAFFAK